MGKNCKRDLHPNQRQKHQKGQSGTLLLLMCGLDVWVWLLHEEPAWILLAVHGEGQTTEIVNTIWKQILDGMLDGTVKPEGCQTLCGIDPRDRTWPCTNQASPEILKKILRSNSSSSKNLAWHDTWNPRSEPKTRTRFFIAESNLPFLQKMTAGMRKTAPIILPHMRWPYSMCQMNLNSSTVKPCFNLQNCIILVISLNLLVEYNYCLYSGNCLYFSNSRFQSSCVSGGLSPNADQCTIESPDSVNLVSPPE